MWTFWWCWPRNTLEVFSFNEIKWYPCTKLCNFSRFEGHNCDNVNKIKISYCFVHFIGDFLLRECIHLCPLVCKCEWRRDWDQEKEICLVRETSCYSVERWHTLLLDRWLGYSAGLAASSQERMEALCGRMSWIVWKGRSSQTETERRRRREGRCKKKMVRRGEDGRVDKTTSTQAPRPSLVLHCLPSRRQGRRWISAMRCWLLAETVAELLGWCPGSSVELPMRNPEETDICVCSQGMWSYPSPVYKDWAVPYGLLYCPRLSVSLTKRFTPPGYLNGLVLHTCRLHISPLSLRYVRCAPWFVNKGKINH